MPFLLALALSFVPAFFYASILYWFDRFEKEPLRMLVGCFLWGALVATAGAIIWSSIFEIGIRALVRSEEIVELSSAILVAPIVEETLKGLAVLIVFLAFRHEFDSILDGIVYAGITALGFAATENLLYLYFVGYAEDGLGGMIGLFIVRVVLGGWGHVVYTAFIGIGLAMARLSRSPFVALFAPLVGWLIAVGLHSLHNAMAVIVIGNTGLTGFALTLLVDWSGWLVALVIVLWAIVREQRWINGYLAEEVQLGTLSPTQHQTASSVRAIVGLPPGSSGSARERRHFYTLCAELAQKKHQLEVLGEEQDNSARIAKLRGEIARLSPSI
jgi:RsiW-degrading membrane proteinase PrsW (M82 family)